MRHETNTTFHLMLEWSATSWRNNHLVYLLNITTWSPRFGSQLAYNGRCSQEMHSTEKPNKLLLIEIKPRIVKKDTGGTLQPTAILMIFDDFLHVSTVFFSFGILVFEMTDDHQFFASELTWFFSQVGFKFCNSLYGFILSKASVSLLLSHDLLSFFYNVLHISSGITHMYYAHAQLYFSLSFLYTNGKNSSSRKKKAS